MIIIGLIINYALIACLLVLFARMILSWVPAISPTWRPRGPMLVVAEFIYTVTDPPLRALRRIIPPVRAGAMQFDVGFILLWFAVIALRQVNAAVFFS